MTNKELSSTNKCGIMHTRGTQLPLHPTLMTRCAFILTLSEASEAARSYVCIYASFHYIFIIAQ